MFITVQGLMLFNENMHEIYEYYNGKNYNKYGF